MGKKALLEKKEGLWRQFQERMGANKPPSKTFVALLILIALLVLIPRFF
jgi:hypothetical protein